MRPPLRSVVVLVLTLGLLAFFFKDVNAGDVWTATRAADARLDMARLVAAQGKALLAQRRRTEDKNARRDLTAYPNPADCPGNIACLSGAMAESSAGLAAGSFPSNLELL